MDKDNYLYFCTICKRNIPVNMIKHLLSLYKMGPTNIDRMSQEFRSHLFDIWFALVHNLEDHVTALT